MSRNLTLGEAAPDKGAASPRRRPAGPPGHPRNQAWLYLAVPMLFYAAFVLYPLVTTIRLSFYEWDGLSVGTWIGLDNYREVLSDEQLRGSFVHSIVLIVYFSIVPVTLGLIIAAVLARYELRGMAVYRFILFLPQVVTTVVIGIAWKWMYATDGVVNQALRAVGLDRLTRTWLGDFTWALPAIGIIGTWLMYGLAMVLFLSGIQKIDPSLYDAARVDGAGPVREFFAVTLPGLRAELQVAFTLTIIAALKSFALVFVTTRGGPGRSTTVPAQQIYSLAFQQGRVGAAAAVAVVLTILISVVVFAINRFMKDPE